MDSLNGQSGQDVEEEKKKNQSGFYSTSPSKKKNNKTTNRKPQTDVIIKKAERIMEIAMNLSTNSDSLGSYKGTRHSVW